MSVEYEVIAVRYGTLVARRSPSAQCETIILDTGFRPEAGERRGRTYVTHPGDALTALGERYDGRGGLAPGIRPITCGGPRYLEGGLAGALMLKDVQLYVEPVASLGDIARGVRVSESEPSRKGEPNR